MQCTNAVLFLNIFIQKDILFSIQIKCKFIAIKKIDKQKRKEEETIGLVGMRYAFLHVIDNTSQLVTKLLIW